MTPEHPTRPAWASVPQPTTFAPAPGRWHPEEARVAAHDPALAREAARLRDELSALGIVVSDDASATVHLRLANSPSAPAEESTITVADDIEVVAGTPVGIFRGTRQLVQNLRRQGFIPRGVSRSAPAVPERGLHLDAARAYYPASWISALLHRMADLGLNALQWHFSENEGVRLARPRDAEFASTEHVTLDQAREILALARDLHIAVVPSLDMPGHLRHALREHAELRLPDDDRALNIARPEALDFARALVTDYAEVFPGVARWTIGSDEFLDVTRTEDPPELTSAARRRFSETATTYDLLTAFANDIGTVVREAGFTPRVWNDGMFRAQHVELPADVEIAWWTNWHADMRPLRAALERGHAVLNFDDAHLYYVLGENAGYTYPTLERLWADDWHPGLFPALPGGMPQVISSPYPAALRGAYFSIWSDRPEAQSPQEVSTGIAAPLAGFAERSWNGGSTLSVTAFSSLL